MKLRITNYELRITNYGLTFFAFLILNFALAQAVVAQTTEFTYQGRLTDGGSAPSAAYDFEFRLFSVETGGAPINTLQRPGIAVVNGIFTVRLDFGAQFDGAARWLEIAVRPAGGGALTTLAPRQSITSAPYSIRALNSTTADTSNNSLQLGGVAANQYVLTTDPRMTDARAPLANSANYIQNTTLSQPSSNFSISGTGTANAFNAAAQYNLGGARILATGAFTSNLFVGIGAGAANNFGANNAFFGTNAGETNTNGAANSFFGNSAGRQNTSGASNAFFGTNAGLFNTTGTNNSFFGRSAGNANTIGDDNSFFGRSTGFANTTGTGNSFFGRSAGLANTTGGLNSFFGANSGEANINGALNSFFGRESGSSNTSGSNNSFFGSLAGNANTTGVNNAFFGLNAGAANTTGGNNTVIGANANLGSGNLNFATAIGAGAVVSNSNSVVVGRSNDEVVVGSFNATGSFFIVQSPAASFSGTVALQTLDAPDAPQTLCRNAAPFRRLAPCSSSLRYKTAVESYTSGLEIVRALRPITFNWLNGGARDLGFGAEEVEKIEPLLTFNNDKGEIEGVKYAQISAVLVNAVKEQQAQIEAQDASIKQLQEYVKQQERLIVALKSAFCRQNPSDDLCK